MPEAWLGRAYVRLSLETIEPSTVFLSFRGYTASGAFPSVPLEGLWRTLPLWNERVNRGLHPATTIGVHGVTVCSLLLFFPAQG